MARRAKAWWDQRSNRYFARLGDVSERTGKRSNLLLRDEDGKPIAYGDHSAVSAAIQRRLAELDERQRQNRGPTVAEICRQYIAWHRREGSAQRTIDTHVHQLNAFCSFSGGGLPFGARPAASIGVSELTMSRRAMEARGNQIGSIRIHYASVLACWRWAARPVEGREPVRLISGNPFEGLARPRRGRGRNQALPWPKTKELIRRGWGLAKHYPYHRQNDLDSERVKLLYLRFVALTGCRPDEAARLMWSELDLKQRMVAMVGKTTSRTNKMRRFSLTSTLAKGIEHLSRWERRHPVYVFLTEQTRKTTPPSSRDCGIWFRGLRSRLLAAGVDLPPKVTLYWLRHDWQSFGLEVESVEGVAAAAGNSPGVLLSTYEHTESRRIREIGDNIDRARRKRGRTN